MTEGGGIGEPKPEVWELRLYVAGQSAKSLAAFANLKKLCDEHLRGRYRIEVIDLLVHPGGWGSNHRERKLPEPLRKIVGDLRDTERTLVGLQLRPAILEQETQRFVHETK
jgi:circadian clock protein KaiB